MQIIEASTPDGTKYKVSKEFYEIIKEEPQKLQKLEWYARVQDMLPYVVSTIAAFPLFFFGKTYLKLIIGVSAAYLIGLYLSFRADFLKSGFLQPVMRIHFKIHTWGVEEILLIAISKLWLLSLKPYFLIFAIRLFISFAIDPMLEKYKIYGLSDIAEEIAGN